MLDGARPRARNPSSQLTTCSAVTRAGVSRCPRRKRWKSSRSRRYAARVFREAPRSLWRDPRYSATAAISDVARLAAGAAWRGRIARGTRSARGIISTRSTPRQHPEQRHALRAAEQRAGGHEHETPPRDGETEPYDLRHEPAERSHVQQGDAPDRQRRRSAE